MDAFLPPCYVWRAIMEDNDIGHQGPYRTGYVESLLPEEFNTDVRLPPG